MLRFITCDDNNEALEKTVHTITKIMMPYDYDYKVSKFNNYCEELKMLIKSPADQKIYILDVEMPKVSGLEIATEIRDQGDWESMIIFVSAHPECKDDIFFSRIMAIDFISKYFDYEKRLEETLKKVLEIYNTKKQLLFNYEHAIYNVPLNKILYIEKVTGDKKCIIRCEGKKRYEVIAPLRFIISKLSEEFYQTHKSCIVNVKQIAQVDFAYGLITFKDGSQTDLLSVRCKRGLRKHVEKYN